MNLVIDIGNTRIKLALFEGQQMTRFEVVSKRSIVKLLSRIDRKDVCQVIIAHSGRLDEKVLDALVGLEILILDSATPLPIVIGIDSPTTVGRDRLAGSIGARLVTPDEDILTIDMGTCITMNMMSKDGRFLGGTISPGLRMRLRAMNKFTDKLPMVELEVPTELIGSDTISALQNGGIKGAFYEIETFIDLMKTSYDVKSVFLTGGDASYFAEFTKKAIFARPYLVLEGLNEILNYNARNK